MNTNPNSFTNGKIVVSYNPKICSHSDVCCRGLAEVFRATVIPWIDLDAASTLEIMRQVKKCPSGALTFCYSDSFELVK